MAEPCNSCGAEIVFEAGKQSLICPFCGTVNQVARPENSLETSFDRIVPITVTPHELDNRLYVYMTSGEFTPDDMIEASTITLRERYYVPAFAFKVDYEATWTASFGFDRQEPYTAYRNVTLNGHTRQEPYTAYKTVTDWRPANGVDSGIFNVAGYAGTQLNGSPLAPANLVVHAVINGSTTEYNPSFIKGFEVEGFSVPEKIAFESLNGEINTIIDKRVQNHAQGDKQRDWHWNARMSHDTSTYAVPICHGAFQYGDKEYHVWVGGHDVEAIRADELPVDKDKQEAANIGFIPGALGLVTAIGSAYYWSFVWSSLIATGIALSYGFMRRKALIDYSKSIRNSLLIQMQASNQVVNLSDEDQDKVAKAFQRPERPFFAQIHKDKIILPTVAAFAIFGAVVPNAVLNPAAISQRYIASQAAERADQKRRNAEVRVAQEAEDRKAAVSNTPQSVAPPSPLPLQMTAPPAIVNVSGAANVCSLDTSKCENYLGDDAYVRGGSAFNACINPRMDEPEYKLEISNTLKKVNPIEIYIHAYANENGKFDSVDITNSNSGSMNVDAITKAFVMNNFKCRAAGTAFLMFVYK